MKKRLLELAEEIDNIVLDLLGPARCEHSVYRPAFDMFYKYLDEIKILVKDEEEIPRRLTGLLFFIYISLDSNIRNKDNYKDPLLLEVAKVEEYLDSIFGAD